jgi:CDP-glucose 4,6-dehydratase
MENPLGQRLRELPGPLLLSGHTGFKGTWMSFLLEHLGVPVVGYSLPAEKDSLFDRAERSGAIPETFDDIRNQQALERFIDENRPSTIIHMAAQPLVLKSYKKPRETFDVNVMGTVNMLDIAFQKPYIKAIIVVTTDKVYSNDNAGRRFVESDPLEGKDPYSSSKVGTEAVVAAWQQIAKVSGGPKIASVRAGNVIGGGDFAENRIIPDLIRGVINGEPVEIRNPKNIRPWQHVLDPIVGYLNLIEGLLAGKEVLSLNFGPSAEGISVKDITQIGEETFPILRKFVHFKLDVREDLEASHLEINSEKSYQVLKWEPKWESRKAIEMTFKWWKNHLDGGTNPIQLCKSEINEYFTDNG